MNLPKLSTRVLITLNLTFTVFLIALVVVCRSINAQTPAAKDNVELARLMAEDQSDRTPPAGKSIDWKIVLPRDRARLAQVKELYYQNQLRTRNDYFNAALILQHGEVPEDFLLAHELCVVAISKGAHVESLAAASEDRFLMNIGRPQRFGTQYHSDNDGPFRLHTMDSGVTDELRRMMSVPSAAEAKAGEAELNKSPVRELKVNKNETSKTNPTQPGGYHKLLDVFAGSWDVTVKFKYGPGPERENKATSEAKWILGGRFLQQNYTSEIGGMPFLTLQYVGYDNQTKRFFEIKMDNLDTGVLHTEGTISQDEKVITNIGQRTDPMSGEAARLRTVTTIIDKDHYTVEWYLMGNDGKEQRTVTLSHTRMK